MSISSELVSQFVRATNDSTGYSGETTAYGTIVVYGSTTYVRLDGSDILTPVVSTTEVNNGERVLVRLKNHTATVTGNVDNPSAGKVRVGQLESSISQTASQIRLEVKNEVDKLTSSITTTADAIRLEVTDGLNGLESQIVQTADSISSIVKDQESFSEFKQTVEGFSFMGAGGTTKISGGDINLTGSITFDDLDKDVKDEIDSAVDTANSASSTANNASTTAGQALLKANSADAAAAEAKAIAQSIDIPSYLKSTYIDSTTIMSPTMIGGVFYAVGQTAWTEMSASGLSIYTGGIAAPKIQLLNENDSIFLILGSGAYGNGLVDGTFVIRKDVSSANIFYYPKTGAGACGFSFSEGRNIYVYGTMVQQG